MKILGRVSVDPEIVVGAALTVAALALVGLLGAVVFAIQTRYFDYYPYFFDHVYYTYFNVRLHEQMVRDGQLRTAVAEWLTNVRHPLRTVPLLLFAPSLLTAQLGHLATSLPYLGIFLILLGLHVHRQTSSRAYAVGCMALFSALPGLLNPRIGLGAYWLETAAAPLLGSAVLCLLLSDRGRHLGWLGGFAMFAALACLSRYVTVAFAVVLCAPIVVVWLAWRVWEERDVLRSLVFPVLVIGLVGGALAGYFLLDHFRDNELFYTYLGPVGQGKRNAIIFTARTLYLIVGPVVGGALLLMACAVFVWARRSRPVPWSSLVLSVWLAGATPALLVIQGAAEALHVVWFVVPPLFIALVAPVPIRSPRQATERVIQSAPAAVCSVVDDQGWSASAGPRTNAALGVVRGSRGPKMPSRRFSELPAPLLVAAVVGALAIGMFTWTAVAGWGEAATPPPNVAGQKALDLALAQALTSRGDGLIWNAYFDEYAWIPSMEAYYRYGRLILPAGQPFYHHHAPHWAVEYPGYTPEALARRITDGTNRLVDLAVVFDDPADADTNPWMTNPHSRAVSRMVAEEVRGSPTWERIATVESTQYGRLAVYFNHVSNGVGYERALRGDLWP